MFNVPIHRISFDTLVVGVDVLPLVYLYSSPHD